MDIYEALEIIKKKDQLRFPHVYGTYEKARELANYYHVDEYKASISAILHDYAKNEPLDKMKEIINNYLDPELLKYDPVVYHGEVGSYLIHKDLGIKDQDIIDAVKYHVTGHPDMNDIAKIIYIADYTENGRRHPGVNFCRELSKISLDIGVLAVSEGTYQYLINSNNKSIHPLTKETYHSFLKKVGVKEYESIKNRYKGL